MPRIAMITDSNLEISVDQVGNDFVVLLCGQIDVYSSPGLRDQLAGILSKAPLPKTVTVDLAGVSKIETSGIATLIEALRIARRREVGFSLRGVDGSVLRLFDVAGVLTLFDVAGREESVS